MTNQNAFWSDQLDTLGIERETLAVGLGALEQGVREGMHPGAQVYVSLGGTSVVDFACGEASPGQAMTPDSLVSWFSACKPLTAMAIALLFDRGDLTLDDPVRRFIPAFGNGKETCTVRHVLTHTGGFAGALQSAWDKSWEEIIQIICAHPVEYPPGSKAGYHSLVGWYVLAELVRRIDGRGIELFLKQEFFEPLAMTDTTMGMDADTRQKVGDRIATVSRGNTERPHFASEAFVDWWNDPATMGQVNPSGGVRGPARDLGRFYEMLLAGGQWQSKRLLDHRTVELFTATHRWEMADQGLMGAQLAWGLGFGKYGNADIHRSVSRRVFNHSGMVSSIAFGDPERQLACVIITNGLLDPLTNARRLRGVTEAILSACGKGAPPAGEALR